MSSANESKRSPVLRNEPCGRQRAAKVDGGIRQRRQVPGHDGDVLRVHRLDELADVRRPDDIDALAVVAGLEKERVNLAGSESGGKALRSTMEARRVDGDPRRQPSVGRGRGANGRSRRRRGREERRDRSNRYKTYENARDARTLPRCRGRAQLGSRVVSRDAWALPRRPPERSGPPRPGWRGGRGPNRADLRRSPSSGVTSLRMTQTRTTISQTSASGNRTMARA